MYLINNYFNILKKTLIKNSKLIFLFLLFLFSILSFIKINKHFQEKRDRKAMVSLFEILERCESLIKAGSFLPLDELINDIDFSIKENIKSNLIPYFMLCKSAIFAAQQKNYEAFEIFEKIKNKINHDKKFSFILKSCFGIFFLKSNDEKFKNIGEKLIFECMNDKNNIFRESAIFYYGLHKFYTENLTSAEEVWNKILKDPKYRNSPYRGLIEKAKNWEI